MAIKLTKIIATLGPATGTRKKIKKLIGAGVNVFRLNLSHGDHAAFRKWIRWIRQAEKELNTITGILLDLQGPKIRVGEFENGFIHLHSGDKAMFTTRKIMGKDKRVPVQFAKFHAVVKPGDLVYLDDGWRVEDFRGTVGHDVMTLTGAPHDDIHGAATCRFVIRCCLRVPRRGRRSGRLRRL